MRAIFHLPESGHNSGVLSTRVASSGRLQPETEEFLMSAAAKREQEEMGRRSAMKSLRVQTKDGHLL